MNTQLKHFFASALLAAVAAAPGVASAQTSSTWNLGASSCGSGGGTTYSTLTCSGSATSETATMTAWGTGLATTANPTGANFASGTLANWDPSGFGAYVGTDAGSPYHAFDSTNPAGTTEAMLISFGPNKVSLTSVAVGWFSTDADVSILRWDGAGVPPALSGFTTAGLVGAGWTLVGSQDLDAGGVNLDNPNITGTTLNAYQSTISLGNAVSSYWMISTYYGAASGSLDSGNDNFKILNFTANVCTSGSYTGGNGGNGGTCNRVPEPGSLALVGVALLGITATRRRIFGRR